jgi:glycosyltransferase involved in cell wall biosynthesis
MRVLVWQWGRRGAGPRFAACLAAALRGTMEVTLSLSRDAEIVRGAEAPACEWPVATYRGIWSLLWRILTLPAGLVWRLRAVRPDLAICAMPGPLDLLMVAVLRVLGARVVVVVHDAERHLGDGYPLQMVLQRLLCRCADRVAVLTAHVGDRLTVQGFGGKLVGFRHPPFAFAMPHRVPGRRRLLFFGRLLPYKGLDLLASALALGGLDVVVRVVGLGPETAVLGALRACPGVTVENGWVPEAEIGALLAWSDAVILPYREASQSGVVAAAIAAGRPVIATRVGGLEEQLAGVPAILCAPEAGALREAIRGWLAGSVAAVAPADAAEAWRIAAEALVAECGPWSGWERWLDAAVDVQSGTGTSAPSWI